MPRFILDLELENGCVDCKCHDPILDKCYLVPWVLEKKEGRQVNCPLVPYTHSNLVDNHTIEMMMRTTHVR